MVRGNAAITQKVDRDHTLTTLVPGDATIIRIVDRDHMLKALVPGNVEITPITLARGVEMMKQGFSLFSVK